MKLALNIVKVFVIAVDTFVTLRLATYALLLADQSSDTAVLAGISIIFGLIIVNAFLIRALFAKSSTKTDTKKENDKNAQ